jgi:hypothetical protein
MIMSKMSEFDALLKGVGTPRELVQLYQKYGAGMAINQGKDATPGAPYSAMSELQYCSGACIFVTAYFTGDMAFSAKAAKAESMSATLAAGAGFIQSFLQNFKAKTNRIAYVVTAVGVAHEFTLVKEGSAYALYQANIATEPKFTLAPALNGGKDYNLHLSEAQFADLLGKLTNRNESNKIFPDNNDCDTYKACFGEF